MVDTNAGDRGFDDEQARLHAVLLQRDHVIGLEAQVRRAEHDAYLARQEAQRLSKEVAVVAELSAEVLHLKAQLAAAEAEMESMRASTAWAVARMMTAPKRVAKKAAR